MKVYLDYIFFINFLFDFILLIGVSLVLKRKLSKLRLIISSIFGGISFFLVFLSISSFIFFIIKILFGLLMVIICFSYKDLKYTLNNLFFLMVLSILLGGFLYFFYIEAGYSHIGMIFFPNNKRINILVLLLLSIFIIGIYYLNIKKQKFSNSTTYKCILKYRGKEYNLIGYLDTGNTLTYYKKPVVILNKDIIKDDFNLFIPFNTIDKNGILRGFKANIQIEQLGTFKNIIVGISNDKFHLEGADIILNSKLWEAKNEKIN